MGVFRILLALAVLLAHIEESLGASFFSREQVHLYIWSGHAVFSFFIISGFYMSLVLNSRYLKGEGGAKKFYINRALRLYPTQLLLLVAYAVTFHYSEIATFLLFNNGQPVLDNLLAVVANASLVGTDIYAMNDNWSFVIGPVWSLSIEIYFYILAPLIVGLRGRYLLALLGMALILRFSLYWAGVQITPWRYFYFPAVFCFFLIGCVSHRLYVYSETMKDGTVWLLGSVGWLAMVGSVVTPMFWQDNGNHDSVVSWLFYLIIALATPFVFRLTKNSNLDRILGQMAYPVYLSHMLVIYWVTSLKGSQYDPGGMAVLVTVALSFLFYLLVDKNIDKLKAGTTSRIKPAELALSSS